LRLWVELPMAWLLEKGTDFFNKAKEQIEEAAQGDLLEKAREAVSNVAEAATNLSETVQAEYRRTFDDLDCQIFRVRPNLLIMEHPSLETIERLAKRLNEEYAERMLIYNMSEKTYEASRFQGEVLEVAFRGLPAPPLELLFELCLSACQWLAADSGNVLVVHCFSGYTRSAVFLSCLMVFRGLHSNPKEALKEVSDALPADGLSNILPSQQRYIGYFQQCLSGYTPVPKDLRLSKVMLNTVPTFETGSVAFRPFLEVWSNGEMIFSSFTSTGSAGSTEDVTWPTSYGAKDPCVSFQLPADLVLKGDILMRVRHVYLDGNKDTVFRLAFHTSFTPSDGLQLAKQELDGACDDQRFSDEFFVDLVFEDVSTSQESEEAGEAEGAGAVFEKAREMARQLREEEERRRREEAAAAKESAAAAAKESAAAAAAGAEDDEDDVEALEATLMRGGTAAADSGTSAAAAPKPKPTGAIPDAAGAEDLKKALAAAAADDAAAAAKQAKASEEPSKGAKGAGTEIDNLFDEFDAALTASQASKPAGGGYGKSEAPPAPQTATSGSKDVFADVDDFLKELDSGLSGAKK